MWRNLLWAVLSLVSALATAGCGMPEPIRVMTFNIRYGTAEDGENAWPHRRQLVFDTIRANDPDVFGLQEVLAFQGAELTEALPEYVFVGVGRDDGADKGEFCPIMFRKKRFTLLESGHFWLSEQPEQPGSVGWDAALPRIATWVRLGYRNRAFNEIYMLNVHFDHQGSKARLESAKLVRLFVEAKAGQPIVVMGDFNCGPRSEPYRELTRAAGNLAELRDPYVKLGRTERDAGTFNDFRGNRSGERIDWILHNRRFEPLDIAIDRRDFDGRYPSDHFPVTATLRLLPATRWGAF